MKVLIKHGELREDLTVEKEALEKSDDITITKVMEIFQNIAIYVKDIKNIIIRNGDAYDK